MGIPIPQYILLIPHHISFAYDVSYPVKTLPFSTGHAVKFSRHFLLLFVFQMDVHVKCRRSFRMAEGFRYRL